MSSILIILIFVFCQTYVLTPHSISKILNLKNFFFFHIKLSVLYRNNLSNLVNYPLLLPFLLERGLKLSAVINEKNL